MASKTTRAFRTISEAGEELGLQPHVLRFWESKFPQIKPIKRGGGRRFYRPEDIELLRGIKILLHDEKHPIKDVQKLIRVKGVQRVLDVGRAAEVASPTPDIADVVLVPDRIRRNRRRNPMPPLPKAPVEPVFEDDSVYVQADHSVSLEPAEPYQDISDETDFESLEDEDDVYTIPDPDAPEPVASDDIAGGLTDEQQEEMAVSLDRLKALKARWQALTSSDQTQ